MLGHLAELRDRIIKAAAAVAIGTVLCWFLYPAIFEVLVGPPGEELFLLVAGASTRTAISRARLSMAAGSSRRNRSRRSPSGSRSLATAASPWP